MNFSADWKPIKVTLRITGFRTLPIHQSCITALVARFGLALILGLLAQRLKLPALLDYLLVGVRWSAGLSEAPEHKKGDPKVAFGADGSFVA